MKFGENVNPPNMSRVTCHVSHVTSHFFFLTQWQSLSVEGMLSMGPTPSSCDMDMMIMKVSQIALLIIGSFAWQTLLEYSCNQKCHNLD